MQEQIAMIADTLILIKELHYNVIHVVLCPEPMIKFEV
jgi:hypothetical protein